MVAFCEWWQCPTTPARNLGNPLSNAGSPLSVALCFIVLHRCVFTNWRQDSSTRQRLWLALLQWSGTEPTSLSDAALRGVSIKCLPQHWKWFKVSLSDHFGLTCKHHEAYFRWQFHSSWACETFTKRWCMLWYLLSSVPPEEHFGSLKPSSSLCDLGSAALASPGAGEKCRLWSPASALLLHPAF